MKRFEAILMVGFIMLLANVTHAQNSVVCGSEQIVLDGEHFVQDEITVYYLGWKYLVFINSKTNQTHCKNIGNGGVVNGLRSFPMDKPDGVPAKLVEIRQGWDFRYFMVADAVEVYLTQDHAGKQYLVHTKPMPPGSPLKIIERWEGDNSRIDAPRYERVTNAMSWKELWKSHRNPSVVVPDINFVTHMAIVIIPGRTLNSLGIEVTTIAEQDQGIQIDFYQRIYRRPSGNVTSTPFGFYLIPRSEKKIIIRQNMQFLQDSPADWRVVREIAPF